MNPRICRKNPGGFYHDLKDVLSWWGLPSILILTSGWSPEKVWAVLMLMFAKSFTLPETNTSAPLKIGHPIPGNSELPSLNFWGSKLAVSFREAIYSLGPFKGQAAAMFLQMLSFLLRSPRFEAGLLTWHLVLPHRFLNSESELSAQNDTMNLPQFWGETQYIIEIKNGSKKWLDA